MLNLKATYNNSTTKTENVIEVPLDTTQPLTSSIIALQAEINTYLTSILEGEKKSSNVTTVQEDEAEEEREEEEEESLEEDDSSMQVDRPEVNGEQASKKQKTN